jgi:hypothetical protein
VDRDVILIPPDPVALVTGSAEHLKDLAALHGPASWRFDLQPVAGADSA